MDACDMVLCCAMLVGKSKRSHVLCDDEQIGESSGTATVSSIPCFVYFCRLRFNGFI